jgi:hypothetical protein
VQFFNLSPLDLLVTAVIHHMISPSQEKQGLVVGIDHLPGLTDLSRRNLQKDGIEVGEGKGIEIVTGDGRKGTPFPITGLRTLIDLLSIGWEARGEPLLTEENPPTYEAQ